MDIVHIIEIRGIGGAEKLLFDFLSSQVKSGRKVYCILLCRTAYVNTTETLGQLLKENGINVIIIKFRNKYLFLNVFISIKKCIREINADVIHTHLRVAEFYLACLKIIHKDLKIVTTIHGYGDKFQSNYIKNKRQNLKLTIRYYVLKFIYRQIDGFAFISKFIYEFYLTNGLVNSKAYIAHISNGISKANTYSSSYSHSKKFKKSLVLPGRIIEWKGHIYAFEAIKILIKRHPETYLDCYGVGNYEKSLDTYLIKNNLKNFIKFKGFTNNIISVISQYDVVVIPSLFESFGVVFLDAFAAGVPVVAFDLPAGNEIITHEKNGLLAQPRSANSLADNIERLFTSQDLRLEIIENAGKLLENKYSVEKMVEEYNILYQRILF